MAHTTPTTRFAWLSIAAAVITITFKTGAFLLTNSVGLLADALESLVNLATAIIALIALIVATRPPDAEHTYGHSKAEYLSSGAEGVFICIAALGIAATAIERLLHPQPVEAIGIGLAVSTVASLINLIVARVLCRAGRVRRSAALEGEARHLMTDVWTSVGVVTGVPWLDSVVGLAVAANIGREGFAIARQSARSVLDTALPQAEMAAIGAVLRRYEAAGVRFHALRTRQAGHATSCRCMCWYRGSGRCGGATNWRRRLTGTFVRWSR